MYFCNKVLNCMVPAHHRSQIIGSMIIHQNYPSKRVRGKAKVKPTTMCIRNGAGVVEDGLTKFIGSKPAQCDFAVFYFRKFSLAVHVY